MKPTNRLRSFLFFASSALFAISSAQAQTFTWDGGGGDNNFGTGLNWVGDATPGTGSGVILEFTGGTRTSPNNNYTTGDNFGEWWLLSGATNPFTITGNGFGLFNKIENSSSQLFTINTAGIYSRDGSMEINPVGGNITIGSSTIITLDNNATLNVYDGSNSRTLTINGTLSQGNNIGGAGQIILNQTANVILTGTNNYGGTTLNSGTTLRIGDGGTTGTLGIGDVTNNGGSVFFNRSNDLTVSNFISGSGTVTKQGAGVLTLSNVASTYTGLTTISAGTLRLGSTGGATNTPLGTTAAGTVVSSGAVLDLNGFTLGTTEALTLNGTGINNGGALTNSSTTTSATYSGLVTLGSASSIVAPNASGHIVLSNAGTITGSGFGLTLDGASTASSIASIIGTGAGTLTKNGGGTWSLTGANTFTGSTTINRGTLNLGGATATGSLASTVLNLGGGTLSYTRTGTNAQNFTTTNVNPGGSTVTTSLGTQTVGLGSIVRTVGGTLNVGNAGTTTTSNTNTNNIIGGWVTANSDNWATKSGSNIAALGTYTGTTNVAANYLNNNMDVGTGSNLTGAGNINANSLRFSGPSVKTLTLDAGDNIIQSGGILVRSDVANNLQTITGGNLLGSASGDLIVHQFNTTNGLTIASLIKNNVDATALTKSGGGLLTLSNASNSYSGGTFINAGTIAFTSDGNFGATSGGITFTGTGGLSYADNVVLNANRSFTINAPASLTLTNAIWVNGVLAGSGTLNPNNFKGYYFTNPNNTFTGTIISQTAANIAYGLEMASIGDTSGAGLINLVGGSGTFRWISASGTTTTLANRQFAISSGAGNVFISAFGATAASNLVINNDLLITGTAGARTLTLAGTNIGNNTFAGRITDGSGSVVGLTKDSAGRWILSNTNNSYTGVTTITAGTLEVASLANGGSNSSIGASTNAASNLVFGAPAATLRYTGSSNVSTDRGFTMSSGAGGGATIESSGTGTLSFDNTVAINYGTGSQTRVLTLGGTNTGDNTFGKVIANNVTANSTSLTKSGIGKWVLSTANSYTGATSVNNGSLEIQSGAGALTQTLGTLAFAGSDGTLISNRAGAGSLSTTFTTLTARVAGNTGNIVHTTGTNGSNNNINLTQAAGFIDRGIFFNGADYAAMNAANTYVRALTYGTDANTVTSGTITAANHVRITSTPAAQNSVSLLSLNLAGATVGWTNNAGQTLTVPGIIKSGGGASAISGGTLTTASNAELVIRTDQAADSLTISSAVSGFSGGLTKSGLGTLTLSGANTSYTGATNINGGALSITTPLATGAAININGSASFTQSGSGFITGVGAFTQSSTGTSTLSLANNFTGTTTVSAGTLAVTNGLALQNSMLTLTAGTSTYSGGAALTVGGLNIAFGLGDLGSANILSGYTGIVTALTLNNSGAATFGGVIGNGSGTMTLTKNGAGVQTLQGANTYTGATTINAGTLNLSTIRPDSNVGVFSHGSILATSGITLTGGGGLTSTNNIGSGLAEGAVNRINDNAGITVNGSGTFTYTNSSNAAYAYAETLGAVTLNYGQFNAVLTTSQAGSQTLTLGSVGNNVSGSGLSRTVNTAAVTFSGAGTFNSTTNRVAVYGSTNTTAGQIVGPWATTGTAANAQTDYAIYSGGYIASANITATAQSTWTTAANSYTLTNAAGSAANGLLSGTRTVNSVRNLTASSSATANSTSDFFTLAANTYVNGDVVSASGTAGLTVNGGDVYYVINTGVNGANTFQLSATSGGPAVNLTDTANGTITGGITLSTGNNLETYGVLNGNAAPLAIGTSGTGVLTTPTGGGNLFLTTGSGGIFINAPITDAAGGGAVTVVRSGSTGRLNLTGINTFSGGLVVNGGGGGNALRLVGTQSFTGGITLNGGGIGENSSNTPPVTQASSLNGNAITVNGQSHLVVEGTLPTTSTITINSNAVLALGAANSVLTVQGVVSGSGVLDVNANNYNAGYTTSLTNTANTFSGNVIYSGSNGANTLSVSSIGDSGKVTIGLTTANNLSKIFALDSLASAPLTFNTRQFELAGPTGGHNLTINNNSAQAFNINTDLLVTGTGTRTLTFGGGTNGGLGTFAGKLIDGSLTSLAITKANATNTWWLTNTANTYSGTTTVSAGTLGFANGALGSVGAINASGGTLLWLSGNTQDISSRLTMAAGTTTLDTGANNVSFSSAIGSASAGLLTKNGIGALTLGAASTYTGTTTVNLGTLAGTQTSGTPFGTGAVAINAGTLSLAPTGSGSAVAVTGGTLAAGTLFTYNVGATLSLARGSQTSLTYTFGGTGNTTARGTNGTLILSTSNIANFGVDGTKLERFIMNGTAPTQVNTLVSGVVIQDRNTSNAGDFAAYNATDGFTRASYTHLNSFTSPGATTNTSVVNITSNTGSGSSRVAYALRVDNSTLTNTGTLTLGGSATGVAGLILNNGTISGGTSLTTPTSVATELTIYTSGTSVISTPILTATSQAGISVFGPGTLDVSGSAGNTFTGGLRINNSTVIATNDNQLGGTTSTITLTGGTLQTSGTFALGGAGQRAIALAAGQNQLGGTFNVSSGTTTYQNALSGSKVLSGAGSLTKTGTGTLNLTGDTANTYTGGTFVNQGTLLVNNTTGSGTGTGAVSVGASGTLGGTGTISGTLAVTGILAPGTGSGDIQTLDAGTTTWNGGSVWNFDLAAAAGSSDQLAITGNFTKGTAGAYQFNFMGSAPNAAANTYTLATWTGSTTFSASDFTFTGLTGSFVGGTFGIVSNSLQFYSAIPEPTSALAGLLLGAGLLRRRRK